MREARRPLLSRVRTLTLLVVLSGAVAVPAVAEDPLSSVLAEFDRVQSAVRTLQADFTETTHSALLRDPIVAEGRIYLTKPSAVRWEYTSPEEMRFVISDDRYTGYFPSRKKAEQRDIHRWREHLLRFLGLGQASSELSRFYGIALAPAGDEMPGTHLLLLTPKKKRVRKRMDTVRFWVDDEKFVPVRIEYNTKNGTQRTIRFRDLMINPDLSASLYTVDLPPDVEVTKGFSALSGFHSAAQD